MILKNKPSENLEALLDFYLASGVDCALDETPHDRFDDMKAARARHLASQTTKQQVTKPVASQATTHPPQRPQISQTLPDAATLQDARNLAEQAENLEALRATLDTFNGCNLKRTAKNLVFGDGNPKARIMFVGEAPGRDEDIQGLPFIGRSGELLNRMLEAIGLSREDDVYIANVVPWRPPGNRTPTPQETELCRPFIDRQIALVNPDILVPLGGASAKQLLQTTDGILKLRGKVRPFKLAGREIEAIATLHPAYLLRQPAQKRLAWQDFLKIRKHLLAAASKSNEN